MGVGVGNWASWGGSWAAGVGVGACVCVCACVRVHVFRKKLLWVIWSPVGPFFFDCFEVFEEVFEGVGLGGVLFGVLLRH